MSFTRRASIRWRRGRSFYPVTPGQAGAQLAAPLLEAEFGVIEDCKITRRDFLGSTLLGAGAALLDGITPAQILAAAAEDDWLATAELAITAWPTEIRWRCCRPGTRCVMRLTVPLLSTRPVPESITI